MGLSGERMFQKTQGLGEIVYLQDEPGKHN